MSPAWEAGLWGMGGIPGPGRVAPPQAGLWVGLPLLSRLSPFNVPSVVMPMQSCTR